jgi:hypothetical protein
VTDNVELESEFPVEIQTVCANMHPQLALVLIYMLGIGECSVNELFHQTHTASRVHVFECEYINTIKLMRQDREPKITTRTDQQTGRIDVPK